MSDTGEQLKSAAVAWWKKKWVWVALVALVFLAGALAF